MRAMGFSCQKISQRALQSPKTKFKAIREQGPGEHSLPGQKHAAKLTERELERTRRHWKQRGAAQGTGQLAREVHIPLRHRGGGIYSPSQGF
jgi:hypothetical protein